MSETFNIESLITDLALILVLGAVATIVFKQLKQPVVLGYIVAGFLASPHFTFLPNVAGEANIEFWAQIGIVVLLFSLGLEFSFKKLINVGGSALVTTLILVLGMMSLGYVVGRALDFSITNAIFLGGMISTSSTTIILKALTDLNMMQRRYVPMIFAVLIVEDLFAVVMMVVLSSIAINNRINSSEMLATVLKLSFFLLAWFIVGIYVLPSVFKRYRRIISDEMMLVIAMGLCFMMAVLSVKAGFSMALGAFVMGSILAGTTEARRIERVITPVKDLFGAVFFISVGMMVNPSIITEHAGTIALLSVVVIVGMIVFGTFGMLATGQPLKLAIESGFTLTQIGEFSFIIATLGMSLGVLKDEIYPIIVAVSVITTFTTPFFIKGAEPFYNSLERMLPNRVLQFLNGYSRNSSSTEVAGDKSIWHEVIKRYIIRLVLYSVVLASLVWVCRHFVIPPLERVGGTTWGRLLAAVVSVVILSPFLYGLIMPTIRRSERERLLEQSGKFSYVPTVVMSLLSMIVSISFVVVALNTMYASQTAIVVGMVLLVLLIVVMSPLLRKRITRIEHHFITNANDRENRRTGRGNTLVSDLHLAYITVGYGCPFVGERLRNADLRRRYGVNVVSIERGGTIIPVPKGDTRFFPADVLGVIGTDEQIQRLLPLVEAPGEQGNATTESEARFVHITLSDQSPLLGKTLEKSRLREDHATLLVAVERGNDNYITPTPDLTFAAGDTLWVVANEKRIAALK